MGSEWLNRKHSDGLYSTSVPYDDNRNELTGKFDFNLNSKDKISATLVSIRPITTTLSMPPP